MTGPTVYLLDRRDVCRSAMAAVERRLSAADRRRHDGFRSTNRREQFALGRALLRWAVAREIGCDPGALEISRRDDGRPSVIAPAARVPHFSLSHSRDWVACAVHPSVAIGLDVECIDRRRDLRRVGESAFGAGEQAWMLRQPDIASAFYRLWTGREALTKLAVELASSIEATALVLVVDDAPAAAPAPSRGWHHEQVRPGVALSLVWAADVGPLRIAPLDAEQLEALHAPAAGIASAAAPSLRGGIRS